jgi:hypothetical protein
MSGATGTAATGTYKVSVGYRDSFIGEGQITYAGAGAQARAALALEIVRERLAIIGLQASELRFDMIGVDSAYRGPVRDRAEPSEVRIRVAGRTDTMAEAVRIGNEVETLYTNGPAGGGGAWKVAREVIAVGSTLIPATVPQPRTHWETVR